MRPAMKKLLLAALLALMPSLAHAASCFWVGGTGTFSTSNTASWASTTGGSGGTCAAVGGTPTNTVDIANFDANSGGGTVTMDSSLNGLTIQSLSMGTYTNGTIAFQTHNPSMTITNTLSWSGTVTRTINMGSGTFTMTGSNSTALDVSQVTGLTATASNANFVFSPTSGGTQSFNCGTNQSYGPITLNARTGGSRFQIICTTTPSTFASLTVTGPANILLSNIGYTFTNGITLNGASSTEVVTLVGSGSGTAITLSAASTATWATLGGLAFSGSTLTATNSFTSGAVTGTVSVSPPSGGGNRIIGN